MRSTLPRADYPDAPFESMRFMSDTAHGAVDYLLAALLITAPFILGFQGASPIGHWLSVAAGASLLVYSMLTAYSLGLNALIPLRMHLKLDFALGALFIAAPFVWGFEGPVRGYYLIFGAFIINQVLSTKLEPATRGA